MNLRELIADAEIAETRGDLGVEISSLAYDSRKAHPGTLFFCVPGERSDGHDFARRAIEAGAAALVLERPLALGVPEVLVGDARAAMAPLAARFWGEPTAELRVAGITGTNGKTTTAFLLREILEGAAIQCGLLGTVKQVVGAVEEEVERTTPEAIDLQATFRRMLDGGDRACAMEVSSHALALHRVDALRFELALFTNLTQDHLDFHRDMEGYYASKRRLFAELGPLNALINVDDPFGQRLAGELDCITFSSGGAEADFRAREVSFDASGARFRVAISPSGREVEYAASFRAPEAEFFVSTSLPGQFNVANALGALAAAVVMGVEPERAAEGLAAAGRVPGRLEPIEAGQEFAVLIDYAHTPDSLENVLRAARRLSDGRVISVFGAGGDRDRDKRPKMGRAGAQGSDLAIITSDNPRSEDPGAIIAEVLADLDAVNGVEVEPDRRAAIALAFERARPGDTVVIAGKGHEQGQEFEHGRTIPFDDREVAREELERLGGTG